MEIKFHRPQNRRNLGRLKVENTLQLIALLIFSHVFVIIVISLVYKSTFHHTTPTSGLQENECYWPKRRSENGRWSLSHSHTGTGNPSQVSPPKEEDPTILLRVQSQQHPHISYMTSPSMPLTHVLRDYCRRTGLIFETVRFPARCRRVILRNVLRWRMAMPSTRLLINWVDWWQCMFLIWRNK